MSSFSDKRGRCAFWLAAATAAALFSGAPLSAARAQDPPGEPLDAEALRAAHTGQDLAGCYLDRLDETTWRERMGADGALYDLEKGAALVGRWWIEGEIAGAGVVCFSYTDREPGPFCFTGRRRGPWLDFYSAFGGELVTTTQCGDEPIA